MISTQAWNLTTFCVDCNGVFLTVYFTTQMFYILLDVVVG